MTLPISSAAFVERNSVPSDDFDELLTYGPLDRPIDITVFPSAKASSQSRKRTSLRDLAAVVNVSTAPRKAGLPLIKLATFGDKKTDAGCYRSDVNMIAIDGVEGDYDGELVSLDEAAERLRTSNLAGVILESPSSTPAGPRWRVLCPLSATTVVHDRTDLCARLNGALGGILESESFTASQSYYFGLVEGSPPRQVAICEGRALDTADELDGNALYANGETGSVAEPIPDCVKPDPRYFAPGELERLLSHIPASVIAKRKHWFKLGGALHHQFSGAPMGFGLWVEHSMRSEGYDQDAIDGMPKMWRDFGRRVGSLTTISTIEMWAREAGYEPEPHPDEFDDLEPLGADTNDDDFDSLLDLSVIPAWVANFNKRHAVAFVEGKTVILTHKGDGGTSYGTPTDLNNFYANDRRLLNKRSVPVSTAWMQHPARASYPNGITFQPNRNPEGAFNLWSGFSVEPDPTKSCDRFLAHLRSTICGGNDVAYQWLVRWFAHMIQRPEEKPGTAVVLRGSKGVGKDTVGDYVGGLFPRHHTKIANAEHLVGRFNANHEKTLLLHVEEGFWAGDHKAEGSLKYIITSPQVQIERKGIDAFQVPSVLRVFVSSNEDWVVPASFDERRFFVLNVTGKKREPAYFDALHQEMHSGGRAALLHYLQRLDLGDFDVRNPPMTEGLRDQKLQSLRSVDRWWYEVLAAGDLSSSAVNSFDDGNACDWSSATLIDKGSLRNRYREWAKEQRAEWRPLGDADFGKKLAALLPSLQIRRANIAGQEKRTRQYEVPALSVCRSEFEVWLGSPVHWDQET